MDNFKILQKAQITDEFKCPKYWPDLQPIPYKLCISRQITKLANGGMQYPDCVECETGKQISKHFKNYQPNKKENQPNWNTCKPKTKKKMSKKGESPYSNHYIKKSQVSRETSPSTDDNIGDPRGGSISEPESNCKNCRKLVDLKVLIKAQVEFAIDLAMEGKLNLAMQRLGLILEEV